jgi:hypothetical protein
MMRWKARRPCSYLSPAVWLERPGFYHVYSCGGEHLNYPYLTWVRELERFKSVLRYLKVREPNTTQCCRQLGSKIEGVESALGS